MQKSSVITIAFIVSGVFISTFSTGQVKWQNVDSLYQPLPSSVHVYHTKQPIDTATFSAYYLIADLKDKNLDFTADTSHDRRLTPSAFFERNNNPLLVVNCTFFSFETNRSLNLVIKNKNLVATDPHKFRKSSLDTNTKIPVYSSALGIRKNRKADVAWIKVDTAEKKVYALQDVQTTGRFFERRTNSVTGETTKKDLPVPFHVWKMKTAVGGGPVLVQNGEIKITNNEELKFAGKAINDKHPRTAMGYTKDNKLVVLVIQGRSESSGGASLIQEAQLLKDLGCVEALNLDGGGSSCMLVNGKETIKPSDKEGQRAVPAVFIISAKK